MTPASLTTLTCAEQHPDPVSRPIMHRPMPATTVISTVTSQSPDPHGRSPNPTVGCEIPAYRVGAPRRTTP